MLVVSDATPLNILIRSGLADLLPSLFGRVIIPPAVADELSHASTPIVIRSVLQRPPVWLEVRAPRIPPAGGSRGLGERQAIALAAELRADLLLMDDKAARSAAAAAGLRTTGTLGVLVLAADKGMLDLPAALDRVRQAGLYLSASLAQTIIQQEAQRRLKGSGAIQTARGLRTGTHGYASSVPLPTLAETRNAIASRRLSAVDATRAALDRLEAVEPKIHAFLQTFPDHAMAQAREIDARLAAGQSPGPLAGVPVALKDNMCLAYGRTTAGSRILENYESPYNGTAVQKLIDAGAIIIGKTNMDEFAMGSSCEHSAFGPTRNPWDTDRVPGGSSGGSASAVAAGIVPLALGSDTGGSIRQPAGLCGVVGMKPTYGRISRYGLVAFASSLDQIGPFTRTVEDCAIALSVLCGPDPHDSTSAEMEVPDFAEGLDAPIAGLKLGVPRQARSPANHPAVAQALEDAISVYTQAGAAIVDVDLPHTEHGIAAYYIVAPAEASSNLARFDGIRYGRRAKIEPGDDLFDLYCKSRAEGFGHEVQRRIMLGTYVLSSGYYDAYYTTALKVRRKIKADYDAAFAAGCHALLLPSSPTPAFRLGEKLDDPLAMYLEDVYTVGVNLAGLPGLTIPGGMAREDGRDLPVGIQLIGPAWQEHGLLRIARIFERATEWHNRHPNTGVA